MFRGRERQLPGGQRLHAVGEIGEAGLTSWPSAETWTPRAKLWATRDPGGPVGDEAFACGLWRVTTSASGAVRELRATAPLSTAQLDGSQALPAGNSRVSNGAPIWASLDIDVSGRTRTYLVDWGQTLEVNCDGISIGWVAAPGWVDLSGATPFPELGEQQLSVELLAFCQMARIESASAQRQPLKLTQTFVVAANTQGAFEVPNGAYSLQLSRDRFGATLTGWCDQAFGAPPNISRINSSIRFENGQSVITSIAPGVSHILPPLLAAEAAVWTCSWLIAI